MSGHEDPLRNAELKYNELVESAQKLASAASYHPNVAIDVDSLPQIGNIRKDYNSEEEAMADLRTEALFLSQKWQEAQMYFEGRFSNQFNAKYGGQNGVSQGRREEYTSITNKMETLEMELWELDKAVGHVLEEPPSEDNCTVKIQGEDFPDEGDFF